MPAKLDTSKPLRLIGIQIYEGTHENVRKVLTPGWYPFIKCKNDDEMGTNTTVYPIITDDGCQQDYYWIDQKRLPRISISAIAGKNGSGKSSLVEILYRILNNFAEELLQVEDGIDTGEVEQVYGLEARLYFEQDGVQKFINLDDGHVTYFVVMDGKLEQINIHLLSERQRYEVLNGFFYTICVNYSLYAFNPADFKSVFKREYGETDDGNWLSYLFHKNDGYYIPLVLTPFREDGQIMVYDSPWRGKEGWGTEGVPYPLAGMFYLRQDDCNQIEELPVHEWIIPIYGQFFSSRDSVEKLHFLSRFVEALLKNIPIRQFKNKGDPDSSRLLYQTIKQMHSKELAGHN